MQWNGLHPPTLKLGKADVLAAPTVSIHHHFPPIPPRLPPPNALIIDIAGTDFFPLMLQLNSLKKKWWTGLIQSRWYACTLTNTSETDRQELEGYGEVGRDALMKGVLWCCCIRSVDSVREWVRVCVLLRMHVNVRVMRSVIVPWISLNEIELLPVNHFLRWMTHKRKKSFLNSWIHFPYFQHLCLKTARCHIWEFGIYIYQFQHNNVSLEKRIPKTFTLIVNSDGFHFLKRMTTAEVCITHVSHQCSRVHFFSL